MANHPPAGNAGTLTPAGNAGTLSARLREKLIVGLEPTRLDVINESELHAGHRSSPGTGESHFRIVVVSPRFVGQSRVARHRMVNALVREELADGVHALAVHAFAPGEQVVVQP